MKQLKKSKRAIGADGKRQSSGYRSGRKAYQQLLDIAASADPEEGIRQGLEDVKKGRTRPAREFFDEFEARHGLPR